MILWACPRGPSPAAFRAQNALPQGSGSPLVAAAEKRRQATTSIPHARTTDCGLPSINPAVTSFACSYEPARTPAA